MPDQISNVPIPTVGEHPRVLPSKNNGRFGIYKKIFTLLVFPFGARIYTRERTRALPCIFQIQGAPLEINYHTVSLVVGEMQDSANRPDTTGQFIIHNS